jgi:hypothetical protein
MGFAAVDLSVAAFEQTDRLIHFWDRNNAGVYQLFLMDANVSVQ